MHPKCVNAQVDFLGKLQSAQQTPEVLDAVVGEDVRFKGGLLVEAFGADFALKRLLLCVHQIVPFQQALLGERLVAKLALVQLLDKPLHNVDLPNLPPIALLMALVHVRLQLLERAKLPVANRARVILARVVPLDVAHQRGVTAEHDRALGTLERFGGVDRPVEGEVFG